MKHLGHLFVGVLSVSRVLPLLAQTVSSGSNVAVLDHMSSIFAPLTLPPVPSATRLATGVPGPAYWQNRTDYHLKATLDTATQSVHGTMVLQYTNHSPDTLHVMWFQTEQRGEVLEHFDQMVDGQPIALSSQHPDGDPYELRVSLPAPILPGRTTTFHIAWHFRVPDAGDQTGGTRMGRDRTLYELGQWYPRPNVYDDVTGWNTESYATDTEFFLEYGDYTIELTVPATYVVAATGMLENPHEVLTPTEINRFTLAASATTVVPVISAADLQSGTARPTSQGMLTWKFHARNVRDAAWAAAPDYQWDATAWHGVLVQAYYRSPAATFWRHAAEQARWAVQGYADRLVSYPYPQVSVVEGAVDGMEYPMLGMDQAQTSQRALDHVLTREVGHNWFPILVGSNERMHTWMDEGFNTFMRALVEAPTNTTKAPRDGWVAGGGGNVIERGVPLGNLGSQYGKTARVLRVLRRDVMGPAVFDTAFRKYVQAWSYKHPTPMDFFRMMATAYGRPLDWFWRECFFEAPRFDQAIETVHQAVHGERTSVTVTYGNKARMVMPLIVQFTFSDGTTQHFTYPAEVWHAHAARYSVSYTFRHKVVRRIVLDPEQHLPDADRSNNRWTSP